MKPPVKKKTGLAEHSAAQADMAATAANTDSSSGQYRLPNALPGEDNQTLDPRKILALFGAYWWLILLVGLAGSGGGVAFCILATPEYRAVCRYEIFNERILNIGTASTMELQTRALGRQIVLLNSDALRARVRNKLAPEWESRISSLTPTVRARGAGSTYLDISVDAVNSDYAVAFLRELISAYEEMRRVEEMTANERALRQLRLEKMRLQNEFQDVRQRTIEFAEKHQMKMTALKNKYQSDYQSSLLNRAQSLRMERTMIGMQLKALEQSNAATAQDVLALTLEAHGLATNQGNSGLGASRPRSTADDAGDGGDVEGGASGGPTGTETLLPGIGDTRKWENYEAELSRLETQYNDQLQRFKPSHPSMLTLKMQLEKTRRNIEFEAEIARKRLRARYDALQIQEEALSNLGQAFATDKNALSIAERGEYEGLIKEADRLSKLVDKLSLSIIDVSAKSMDSLVTRLVSDPRGVGQIWPKNLEIIGGTAAASIGLGGLLAFLLFYFDTRFMDVVAIEKRLGLPFIGGIPRWDRVLHDYDPDQLVVMDRDHPNAASESYRSLRITLESSMQDKPGYALLMTSADAGEGKSVTTANLGIAFSWTGKRVLLVDADLRRPNLHNVLGLKNPDKGLTQLLMGEVTDWREILRHTEYENVDFLPAGKFLYEASEMCSPATLGKLKEEWAREYDILLFDSAPVGRIVDTVIIARGSDGIVLMSLHGKSSFPAMRHALRRLEGLNVLGFCLNAIDIPRGHGAYYGGYSGYKWRYGLYSYYDYYTHSLYGYDAYYYVEPDKAKDADEGDGDNDDDSEAEAKKSVT